MPEDSCPVRWAGQQAVVALPGHMDESSAGHIREELLSVINHGARVLTADMTATTWCDHAGADAVARAFQRGVISGTELRLVVSAPIVLRVLSLSGVDQLVSIYPSLDAATAVPPPATVPAQTAAPAGTGSSDQPPPTAPGRQATQPRQLHQRMPPGGDPIKTHDSLPLRCQGLGCSGFREIGCSALP